jgi:hypothetical protein
VQAGTFISLEMSYTPGYHAQSLCIVMTRSYRYPVMSICTISESQGGEKDIFGKKYLHIMYNYYIPRNDPALNQA